MTRPTLPPDATLDAALRAGIRVAIYETRRQDARAVCPHCRTGAVPSRTKAGWWHGVGECGAGPIWTLLQDDQEEGDDGT